MVVGLFHVAAPLFAVLCSVGWWWLPPLCLLGCALLAAGGGLFHGAALLFAVLCSVGWWWDLMTSPPLCWLVGRWLQTFNLQYQIFKLSNFQTFKLLPGHIFRLSNFQVFICFPDYTFQTSNLQTFKLSKIEGVLILLHSDGQGCHRSISNQCSLLLH